MKERNPGQSSSLASYRNFHIRGRDLSIAGYVRQRRQSGLKSGGVVDSKNFDFLGKFPRNLDSFTQFHKQKIDFSG